MHGEPGHWRNIPLTGIKHIVMDLSWRVLPGNKLSPAFDLMDTRIHVDEDGFFALTDELFKERYSGLIAE